MVNCFIIKRIFFSRHYRFTKEGVLRLTDLFEPYLRERDARGSPLTPVQRVCLVLSYYGGGHFQHTSGLIAGSKESRMCQQVLC